MVGTNMDCLFSVFLLASRGIEASVRHSIPINQSPARWREIHDSLCPRLGIFHQQCSLCFPDLREMARRLQLFSQIEWSAYCFDDRNYLWVRITGGYSVIFLP
jgi:hypothetical protein